MTLLETQILEKVKQKTLEYLKEGKTPGNTKIFEDIRNILVKNLGLPTAKYRPQSKNKLVDYISYNATLDELKFDFEVLYKEVISHLKDVISSYYLADTVYKVNSKDLDRLLLRLDNELLAISNADDNFAGYSEKFDSLDNIDQSVTTPGIVDLSASELALPASQSSNFRYSMRHLFNFPNWEIKVNPGFTIIENQSLPGAGFGNAFIDILSAWRHSIKTRESGELRCEFIIPVGSFEETELLINKITVMPHGDTPFKLRILKSTDNINYTILPGYGDFVDIKKQSSTYTFNFNTELIQYLKFEIIKQAPDVQINSETWQYIFGFFNISVFVLGRANSGICQTKPIKFSRPVGAVSLNATSIIPPNTDINYYVNLADSTGAAIYDWRPISPSNATKSSSSAPRVVYFSNKNQKTFSYYASGSIADSYKNSNLYVTNSGNALLDDHIFGAYIERGFNMWKRDTNPQKERFDFSNAYINFENTDYQSIYINETETLAPIFSSGSIEPKVITSRNILYRPEYGHSFAPNDLVNPSFDQQPTYAIYEAKIIRKNNINSLTVTGYSALSIQFDDNTIVDNENRPEVHVLRLTTSGGSQTNMDRLLRENIDYEIVEVGSTSVINALQTSGSWWNSRINEGSSLNFFIRYQEEDNLINRISSINNKEIGFNLPSSAFKASDLIRVKYRAIPDYPNIDILSNSLRVKPLFNSSDRVLDYVNGRDYSFDKRNSTLYRIPNGNIPSQAVVYVDYSFEKIQFYTETFSIWAYIGRTDFPEINIESLSIKKNLGEQFYLSLPGKFLDLINTGKIPALSKGWYLFIVKSTDPSDSNSAIKKIMSFRDSSNNLVFSNSGLYFNEMIGSRERLKEVTYDFLKKGILKSDNRYFAIKNGLIHVNFNPGYVDSFYPFYYDSTNNVFIRISELFKLSYSTEVTASPSSDLLVKIELVKDSSADGGTTPIVKDFDIRMKI